MSSPMKSAARGSVTRHILEETRRNSDDLAVLKTRVARVEGEGRRWLGRWRKPDAVEVRLDRKVSELDQRVGGLGAKIDRIEQKVDTLARDIPRIVADTMRAVVREGRARK